MRQGKDLREVDLADDRKSENDGECWMRFRVITAYVSMDFILCQ